MKESKRPRGVVPGRRPAPSRWVRWLYFACAALTPCLGFADGTLSPYAGVGVQHNTNVFDLPSDGPRPLGKDGPTFADSFLKTWAGADGTYTIDRQTLFGTAEFRRFDYDHFTYLDHNEYLFDGGLKYNVARIVDGVVEYRHEQRMVQFQDLIDATQLILETSNDVSATANVTVTPEWRWENSFTDHKIDSPRTDVPGLSYHEDAVKEGVKYTGFSNLAAGIDIGYLKGQYSHDPLALDPNYHQISAAFAAKYLVSGLTSFTGELGYTKRYDPINAGLSGVTGRLSYLRSLSAKSSLTVNVSRVLNTYITTAGSEIDTSAGATLSYQATYKIMLRAGYNYTNSKYPGAPDGFITIDRVDHFQTATLDGSYQVLHWLSIKPYASYRSRHSNQDIFTFSGTVVGVELVARPSTPYR